MKQTQRTNDPAVKRIYVICGTTWYQGQLIQREYEQLKDINKMISSFMEGEADVQKMFDILEEKGGLRRLVNTVLKLDEQTLWAKIRNRYYAWRRRVDLSDPYASMTNEEVAAVGADYFFFRTRWIGSFFASPGILESISRIRPTTPEPSESPSTSSITN